MKKADVHAVDVHCMHRHAKIFLRDYTQGRRPKMKTEGQPGLVQNSCTSQSEYSVEKAARKAFWKQCKCVKTAQATTNETNKRKTRERRSNNDRRKHVAHPTQLGLHSPCGPSLGKKRVRMGHTIINKEIPVVKSSYSSTSRWTKAAAPTGAGSGAT
ncbi:hypothetical protein TGPRC2_307815 [Toxoplasma gondii TgCatPRC2]|uniref:Uncharacterized protein n=1 Tax=Toxoplasma gondii TgCatPRC2 TaxID=1130821 RepID=A0A151GZN5_TOXGO|nr:hypothetical protein TGPRC2_307815 [Toxoplasma gondii TgCatPRC2]